jgi:glycosyltransferase involved in cell wall biosynthesis
MIRDIHIAHVLPSLDRSDGGLPAAVVGLVDNVTPFASRSSIVASIGPRGRAGAYWPADPAVDVQAVSDVRVKSLRSIFKEPFVERLEDMPVKPDVLHVHGLWLPQSVKTIRWASLRGIPVVISTHGMLTPWAIKNAKWKKKVAWLLYQKRALLTAAIIHATSEVEARGIRNLLGKRRIAVIPNGIEMGEMTAKENGECGHRTVGFLGRLHHVKGLAELLKAWSLVDCRGWTLRLAGPDEAGYQRVLEELARDLNIATSVEFVGAVSGAEKARFFAELDAFVLPSHSENFGLVVAEALACGIPCIASHGTPWEGLETEKCGWWVENSPESLAKVLREVIATDRISLQRMGQCGRNWVGATCAWSLVAKRFGDLYTSLVATPGKRSAAAIQLGSI